MVKKEQKFSNLEGLIKQMKKDVDSAELFFKCSENNSLEFNNIFFYYEINNFSLH